MWSQLLVAQDISLSAIVSDYTINCLNLGGHHFVSVVSLHKNCGQILLKYLEDVHIVERLGC